MPWIVFALLSAIFRSLWETISKHGLKDIKPLELSWFSAVIGAIISAPLLLLGSSQALDSTFWAMWVVNSLLGFLSLMAFMNSLKISDLSLVSPINTFSPIFILVIGFLILRELPTPIQIFGILSVVVGAYVLRLGQLHEGPLAPLKAIAKDRGSRLMFASVFTTSLASVTDKIGILHSSPYVWIFAVDVGIALILTPFSLKGVTQILRTKRHKLTQLFLIGLLSVGFLLFQLIAIQYTPVANVVSVKRLSVILSVILGYKFFKEKDSGERLAGALLMAGGAILLAFF